ncbi:serine hydrolase [Streptomyces sp. Edi4]|uniref:serine hydrolase n=1 Tax=Streptomyces sp. Edi4 TaxID=3162527 RepID=UPI003305D121
MAGESPDKSEQKQSSGETATSERDPRLALSHSPSPSGAPSGSPSGEEKDGAKAVNGSGSGSGESSGSGFGEGSEAGTGSTGSTGAPVDQATAVFRTPRQEDGDTRLRAAVAAWVDQEGEDAESSTGAGAGEDAGEGASGRGGAKPAAPDGDEAKAGAIGAAGSGAAATNVIPAVEPDASKDAEKAAAGSEAATPDVATAKKSTDAAERGAKGDADASAATDAEADDDADSGARAASWGAAKSTPAAEPDEADADAAPSGTKAAPSGTKAAPAESGDGKSDDDKASGTKSSDAKSGPAKSGEGSGDAESDADKAPGVKARRAQSGDAESGEAKSGDDKSGDDKAPGTKAGPAESGEAKSGDAKATPDAERGIDQPTTTFKPVVAAPAVDQPTAMLKLPAPKREPDVERAGERAGERAERSSQFVPLRSDDAAAGAAAGKPEAPAKRPEAPKVTPPPPAPGAPIGTATGAAVPERAERTRQQPLPPKPPLDLLAELTNTPPPAQTAVRSTVRRFKIWTPLVLLLLVVFAVVQIMRPLPAPKLDLTSSATYTFEGSGLDLPWPSDGQSAITVDGVGSLGTHGEQKPAPLASVAKTMTAYVILKGHPISGKQEGEKITVDQQAEDDAKKPDESTAPIRKDQQFTEKQMLELLMIPSGNNAARLLARWDAGNEEAFIAKMNATAKELGMTNSTYTDPSGLKETTVSTPTDQLKLAQAVMQNDVFREIVNTPQIKIPGVPTMIYNNNKILLKPGVSGIKTGSSTPAGGNLLWAADTVIDGKNQRIYGIVMGQRTGTTLDAKLTSAINNSYKLIQAVQKDVTSATVVKKGDVVGYVDDGLGGRTPLVAAKDLKAVGWPGLKVDVKLGAAGKPVPHSAKAGDVVGELSIGSGNGRLTAPVQLKSALAEPGVGAKLTRLG